MGEVHSERAGRTWKGRGGAQGRDAHRGARRGSQGQGGAHKVTREGGESDIFRGSFGRCGWSDGILS